MRVYFEKHGVIVTFKYIGIDLSRLHFSC